MVAGAGGILAGVEQARRPLRRQAQVDAGFRRQHVARERNAGDRERRAAGVEGHGGGRRTGERMTPAERALQRGCVVAERERQAGAQSERREGGVDTGAGAGQGRRAAGFSEAAAVAEHAGDRRERLDGDAAEWNAVSRLAEHLCDPGGVGGAGGVGNAGEGDAAQRRDVVPAIGRTGAQAEWPMLQAAIDREIVGIDGGG